MEFVTLAIASSAFVLSASALSVTVENRSRMRALNRRLAFRERLLDVALPQLVAPADLFRNIDDARARIRAIADMDCGNPDCPVCRGS